MTTTQQGLTVVTGGTSKTGRRVAEPFVDVDDLADVAFAALTVPAAPDRVLTGHARAAATTGVWAR